MIESWCAGPHHNGVFAFCCHDLQNVIITLIPVAVFHDYYQPRRRLIALTIKILTCLIIMTKLPYFLIIFFKVDRVDFYEISMPFNLAQ